MEVEAHTFSISEAAGELGVSISYLRLAERLGIAAEPSRTAGGHRRYTRGEIEELRRRGVGQHKKALAERCDG